MPYIPKTQRDYFDTLLVTLSRCSIANAGELNFLFTEVIKAYFVNHPPSYQHFNDVIGALECCKQELYRRQIGPYENVKIEQNGDVYDNT